jgi:hypothetical protein
MGTIRNCPLCKEPHDWVSEFCPIPNKSVGAWHALHSFVGNHYDATNHCWICGMSCNCYECRNVREERWPKL